MREADEAIVICEDVRRWSARLERDESLKSSGAWPEQALRNLARKIGLPRRQPLLCTRLVLPHELEEQIRAYKTRRSAWRQETVLLREELIEVASRLLRLGVRQRRTADYLDVKPQRLGKLLARRAQAAHRREHLTLMDACTDLRLGAAE